MGTEVKDFETLKIRDTRKAAYAVVPVAMGVALAPYTSFPIGIAKVNPTQHFVNVIGALLLGPWWAVVIATIIAVLPLFFSLSGLSPVQAGRSVFLPSIRRSESAILVFPTRYIAHHS